MLPWFGRGRLIYCINALTRLGLYMSNLTTDLHILASSKLKLQPHKVYSALELNPHSWRSQSRAALWLEPGTLTTPGTVCRRHSLYKL